MPTIKSVPSFPIQIPLNHKTMEYSFRALPLQDILHQARQKDKLFLTKFARKNPDDSIVREFKIVPNPDSISYNDIYWIVRLTPDSTLISTTSVETTTNPQSVDNLSAKRKGKKRALDLDNNYSSSSTQQPQQAESSTSKKRKTRSQQQLQLSETTHDTSQQDSDHPLQLLECTVYGEISFLEAGSYGNWVPREADNVDNITFPKEDPQKATISITLKAIALVAESLRIIDEEMKAFLETSDKLDTYNYMVKKDHITIKYPLLVAREEVAKSQGKYSYIKHSFKIILKVRTASYLTSTDAHLKQRPKGMDREICRWHAKS